MRTEFQITIKPLANGFMVSQNFWGSDDEPTQPPMAIHVANEQDLRHELSNFAMACIGYHKEMEHWRKEQVKAEAEAREPKPLPAAKQAKEPE